jgi:hypothetical protein
MAEPGEEEELLVVALTSQLACKQVLLSESIQNGVSIEASVLDHCHELELEANAAREHTAELIRATAKMNEENSASAVQLEVQIRALDTQLTRIYKREREALKVRESIRSSGQEEVSELKNVLSLLEQECAKLQLRVGKRDIESGPLSRLQQHFNAKQVEAAPPAPLTTTNTTATTIIPTSLSSVVEGYLFKASPTWMVGLQKRYFYLEKHGGKPSMTYFKTNVDRQKGLAPQGQVPIADIPVNLLSELILQDKRKVLIKTKSRTYELQGSDIAEAEQWVANIRAFCV